VPATFFIYKRPLSHEDRPCRRPEFSGPGVGRPPPSVDLNQLDALILARDLGLSLAAVSTGVVAPFLHRKFAGDEEKDKAANN
jgi:hypothetical protein